MNIRKNLLPVCVATLLGTSAIAANNTKEISGKESKVVCVDEQNKNNPIDYMSDNPGTTALIGLGILGAGSLGYIKGKKSAHSEQATADRSNDVPKDIQSTKQKCKDSISKFLKDVNSRTKYSSHSLYCDVQSFISSYKILINKRKVCNEEAKKELVSFLDNIYNTVQDKSDKTVQDYIMSDFTKVIYLTDKMLATHEGWNKAKSKYPSFEKNIDTDEWNKHRSSIIKEYNKANEAKKAQSLPSMLIALNNLRNELLKGGGFDNKAYYDCIRNIDYLESQQIDFSSSEMRTVFHDIYENFKFIINNPNGESKASSSSSKAAIDNKRKAENTTTKTEESQTPQSKNTKSKKDEYDEDVEINTAKNGNITFADIGGQDKVIEKIKKTIMFPMKYPEAYKGRMINHGTVLYGPPGTGKTLIAQALANESDANFIKLNGLEMSSCWVGQSEKNWRNLFEKAKKNLPCIIFVDEFDAVAKNRGEAQGRHDDKVVNQLLTLISDIEKNGDNIFIIAATNRLDTIDSAILRSGRLGNHIEVLAPDTQDAVKNILDIHLKKCSVKNRVNQDCIAHELLEMRATGADIAAIVNAAVENAYERSGIYEKMENGSFTPNDMNTLEIIDEDIFNAISEQKNN